MTEKYDIVLNEFELKACGISSSEETFKQGVLREYNDFIEVVYEIDYEDMPIFPKILTRTASKKEEVRGLLIKSIKDNISYIKKVKDKKYSIDFFDEMFDILEKRLAIDYSDMHFLFIDENIAKIRTKLDTYIGSYTALNKQATYKDVVGLLNDFAVTGVVALYEIGYD